MAEFKREGDGLGTRSGSAYSTVVAVLAGSYFD